MENELAEVNRRQIEHRALWMALIWEEMVKSGVDAEGILRRAISRCGKIHGENFKKLCGDHGGISDFAKVFLNDLSIKTFEMTPEEGASSFVEDEKSLKIDFHYCALLNAWKKLDLDGNTCALLCDIAMEGDRGIAETMGYEFKLGKTIAQGCGECKLHFKN